MRAFLITGVLVAAIVAPAAAEEATEIKVAVPKVGEKVRVTVQDKTVTKAIITVGGMDHKQDETKVKSLVYVDEVLAVTDGVRKPTKLKRTYEKAVLTNNGKDTTLPVEKQTVLIEKKGAKYAFTIDGMAVDGESAKLLDAEFNKSGKEEAREIMFPKKAVKPGESWKIDPDQLVKALGESELNVNKEKLEANGRLVKTYKVDGKQFGVIELKVQAPLTDLVGKMPFKVKTGDLAVTMTGDGCIDGASPVGKSTVTMKLAFDGEGNGLAVKADVTATETRTTEVVK